MKLFSGSGKQTWDAKRKAVSLSGISVTYVQMKPLTFLNNSISQLEKMIAIKSDAEAEKKARDELLNCKSQITDVMQIKSNTMDSLDAVHSETPTLNRRP